MRMQVQTGRTPDRLTAGKVDVLLPHPPLTGTGIEAKVLLNALPNPVLALDRDDTILDGNGAAEIFFESGMRALRRQRLHDLLPPASPVLSLVAQAREQEARINELERENSRLAKAAPVTAATVAPHAASRAEPAYRDDVVVRDEDRRPL